MKKLCAIQSNYIPWKGYFDLIASTDVFVVYDHVQFTKNDWRNRNKIKTPNGAEWLSIPVGQDISRRICDVVIPRDDWQRKHWKTIVQNYSKARCFGEIAEWLEPIYMGISHRSLSNLNIHLIRQICSFLQINTKIISSTEIVFNAADRVQALVEICVQFGARVYMSGPAARSYLNVDLFNRAGIGVEWMDYSGYQEYPQLWGAFIHEVSILDLLMNHGRNSRNFMKCGPLSR